jgi:hypothetical protein
MQLDDNFGDQARTFEHLSDFYLITRIVSRCRCGKVAADFSDHVSNN